MKIIKTVITKKNKTCIKGYLIVKEGDRKHKVQFDQDGKGNYGWFQWGAGESVLSFTQPTVERITRNYLEEIGT